MSGCADIGSRTSLSASVRRTLGLSSGTRNTVRASRSGGQDVLLRSDSFAVHGRGHYRSR
jgi:hypothetical protein